MKARIPDNRSWAEKRMEEIEKLMEHPLNAEVVSDALRSFGYSWQ